MNRPNNVRQGRRGESSGEYSLRQTVDVLSPRGSPVPATFATALFLERLVVSPSNIARRPILDQLAHVKPQRPVTELLNKLDAVRHAHHRLPLRLELQQFLMTFCAESRIANRNAFVHQQNIRLHVRRDRETQTKLHAR